MGMCQNKNSLTACFFLGTDYTDFTDFLYSFSVKSVPKRDVQVYFDTPTFALNDKSSIK